MSIFYLNDYYLLTIQHFLKLNYALIEKILEFIPNGLKALN